MAKAERQGLFAPLAVSGGGAGASRQWTLP